jgi:AcrR family transcriptional regulator
MQVCSRLKRDARSGQILQAAIQLFARKGFQGTKTKEIAEAAGINEALIFRDFQTKEKLYCAILEYASSCINCAGCLEELAVYAEHRNDAAIFSTLALRLFECFDRERDLFRLMLYSALENHQLASKFRERQIEPLERFIESYLRTRQQEGAFHDGDPRVLARSFLSMCNHHILRHVLTDDSEWPADEATANTFTKVFLDGVRSHVRTE